MSASNHVDAKTAFLASQSIFHQSCKRLKGTETHYGLYFWGFKGRYQADMTVCSMISTKWVPSDIDLFFFVPVRRGGGDKKYLQ